jgi:hypothetical protein
MVSLTKIKTIPALSSRSIPCSCRTAEEGRGQFGALGQRHRRAAPRVVEEIRLPGCGVAKLDPEISGRIKGINIPQISNDGKFLAADSDLGVVGVIDPREDKVIRSSGWAPIHGAST